MGRLVLGTFVPEEYPYVYETHLHTRQSSACGKSDAAEMARACKAAGYTGIFVSDHFFYGNTAIDRSLGWRDWVEEYCKGYEVAKEEGDRIGLSVFFAWEASYEGTDFLVYGLDKEWLINHPQIRDASVEEQYRLVHADGGMVIHAHPFRRAPYIKEIRLFPEYVDGVEVYNTSHDGKGGALGVENKKALEYAKQYRLPRTSGSDIHSVDLTGGGMAFAYPLKSARDFIEAVQRKEGYLLPYGNL